MNRSGIVIAIGLFIGTTAVAIVLSRHDPETADGAGKASYFDQAAAIEDRIRALETAVAEERNARQLLEEELQALYAEIAVLSERREEDAEQKVANADFVRERLVETRQQFGARGDEMRLARLVSAGFSAERAEWLLQRESELQMQAMQARFDARRAGEAADPFDPAFNFSAALRAEIGDVEYAQYLEASGRPTAVSIVGVLESSPGQAAGLQAGDNIIRYGGTRVFDINELNQQIMTGQADESVIVEFTRDGVPMQVVLPRGPIGVTTGRFPGRR